MKTAVRIIAAGLAASLALVSCAKQDAIENGSTSPADGVRTIAVSFANSSTKSTLDGFQPKFVGTDVIKVTNGTDTPEDCTVSIDGSGNASIITSLTGTLTMVYPSTAAKMNGNAIDGILVPTVQDGTFASANICKAENIAEGATSATFANQTAVFCITPGAGASTKYVEVITAGAEIANSVPEGSEYDTMHKIHVASASAAPVYVSILVPEGLRIRDLSFADGSNMKTLKDDTDAIAVNSLYTITNKKWNRPYVDLQMTVGDKTRTYKWATMNVGAASSTDAGLYFMWGETNGMPASNISSTNFPSSKYYTNADNSSWDQTKGFGSANSPWTDGVYSDSNKNVFTKYTASDNAYAKSGTADGKTTLELEDDAANANWGGTWRMPTSAEFQAMKHATYWKWDSTDKGYYVYAPNPAKDAGTVNSLGRGTYDKSSALLFFPAAGFGGNAMLLSVGAGGNYWLSSLYSSGPNCAYYLFFNKDSVHPEFNTSRFSGKSVRPVSD